MTDNLFFNHDHRVFENLIGSFVSATRVAEEDYTQGVNYEDIKKKWLRECRRQIKEAAEKLSLAGGIFWA